MEDMISSAAIGLEREHEKSSDNIELEGEDVNENEVKPPQHTNFQRFVMLTKFMFPLVITLIVPNITEQVVNRSITSLASSEMVLLLASFGLATIILKIFTHVTHDFRQIGIVLVESMADYKRMLILSTLISGIFCILVICIGLSMVGRWLIGDIYQQSKEVVDLTLYILCCLTPLPPMEGLAHYHEGGLIRFKLTHYAAVATFADVGFQAGFVMILIFTPVKSEPILIPISALYAGMIARLILDIGFWYVIVRRELMKSPQNEKPVTMLAGCKFYAPLALTRLVQVSSLPMVNLAVSRQLAKTSRELAAEALAILTVIYPTVRVFFTWLNDLITIIPTFYKTTKQHQRFPMKVLLLYAFGCTSTAFVIVCLLYMNPTSARFIMHKIMGVTPELAEKSLAPIRVFSLGTIVVGVRAISSSYLIYRKKTVYLTPSAFFRFAVLLGSLIALPYTGLSGPVFGLTALLLGFVAEDLSVISGILLLKYVEPSCVRWKQRKSAPTEEHGEETKFDEEQ